MKLSTLLFVGALVFGGLFVARNADDWMNRLHKEKTHLTAELKQRLHDEEAHVRTALKQRVQAEKARAAAAVKKRLAKQKARATALRKTTALKSPPTSAPPGVRQTETAVTGMAETAFWRLISETRSAADNDTAAQSELLKERLTQLSPQAITEFAQIRRRLDQRAYTWDLWGAASVIEDGCSDDCFRNFRGYLISLGQGPYENALRDPDSLASVAQDAETGNWENADDVAPDAYSSVTGEDFPLADSDLSGQPGGTTIDLNDTAGLAGRYPKLAARFR
jgi:uncharacterized protein DUF4240